MPRRQEFIWHGFLKVKEAWARKCKIKSWADMLVLVAGCPLHFPPWSSVGLCYSREGSGTAVI